MLSTCWCRYLFLLPSIPNFPALFVFKDSIQIPRPPGSLSTFLCSDSMFFCSAVMYATCFHLSPFKLTALSDFSVLTPCHAHPLGCNLFWRQKEFLFDFVPQLLTDTSYTSVFSEWSILPLWPLPFFYPPPSLLAHLAHDEFPPVFTTFSLKNKLTDLLKSSALSYQPRAC